MDRSDDWWSYQKRNVSPELIKMEIMKQQAFQSEMRRMMEEPPPARNCQQQLDDMLQQSALLITRLSQRQEQEETGPGLGEELDKINKILSAIGGNLNLDEMAS